MTAARLSPYASYALLLLFLANVENYSQRLILAILLPAIKTDLSLSDGQLGVLVGGAFGLFFATAGVPLARFAERHGRVKWLSIAVVSWSAASCSLAAARTFLQMVLARIAVGVSQSVCIPTSHSLLSDYVAEEQRPFAFGVHSTGGVVGATVCLMLGGYLQAHVGWREALLWIACPGVVVGALVILTLREPDHRTPTAVEAASLGEVVRTLLAIRSYALVLIAVCFATLVEFGLNQWLPSYYVRQFGLSVSDVGLRYGLAVACGGIPGSLLGGLLATALARRDRRWLVWFPAAMYCCALPVGLSMLLASTASTALVLNGLYSFVIFTTNGALWAACFVGVPAPMRATTSAITLLIAGVTGLTAGPALAGALSDFWSSRLGDRSLQAALVSVETLAVCVVVPLVLTARTLYEPQRSRPGGARYGRENIAP